MLLWDGGNNDLPFYRPNVWVTVTDPLRAGHELTYHPGEANLRAADVIVINKMDSATPEQVAQLEGTIAWANPGATVVKANSKLTVEDPSVIQDKRVLVVEDGPTLTHGNMKIGAGVVAAERGGAAQVVDPRPWAIGTIAETFEKYDVGPRAPGDGLLGRNSSTRWPRSSMRQRWTSVVIGTPIDLRQGRGHPQAGDPRSLRPRGAPRLADARRRSSAPVLGSKPAQEPPGRERHWSAWLVALGGNALLRKGAEDTYEEAYASARRAAERIADIAPARL